MPNSEEFRIPADEEIAAPPAGPPSRPTAPSWQQLLDEVTISLDELHRRQRAVLPLLGDFPEDPQLPQLVPAIRAPLDTIRTILSQFTVQVRGGLRSVNEVTTAIEELDNAISSLTGYQRNLQNWASLRTGGAPAVSTNLFQDLALLSLLTRGVRSRECQVLINLVAFLASLREWIPAGWELLSIFTHPLRLVARRARATFATGSTPVLIHTGAGPAHTPDMEDPEFTYEYCDFRGLDY
eukprot:jgi/Mesvir1/20840/Mv07932-RA.1